MSEIRLKTIKRELANLQIEVRCADEALEEINVDKLEINEIFDDKFEVADDCFHTAKIIINRLKKLIKDYKKSIENKKNTKIAEISL